jgi:hypothetical protein
MTHPEPVPLSPGRHGRARWRRFTSYDFARDRRHVPVVLAEIGQVAAAMPIVFARPQAGAEAEVLALLRLTAGGGCAFVGRTGLWLATYVPSLLRVHPFSARPSGDGRMLLMVDEESGLVLPEGQGGAASEAFFGSDGRPSPALEGLVAFFRQREASALRTRGAVAALDGLGLMAPLAPGAELPAEACEGLLGIDRATFEALPDADHTRLRHCGALDLVHAHFVSMHHMQWLARAERARDEAGPGIGVQAAAPAGGVAAGELSEFIAAIARAGQEDGLQDPTGVLGPAGSKVGGSGADP